MPFLVKIFGLPVRILPLFLVHSCPFAADWNEVEVADFFLKRVGMDHLCGTFIRSGITGPALVALREEHLVEMGCTRLGDRLLLMEYIQVHEREQAENDTCFAFATISTKSRSTLVITRCYNIISVSTCVSKKKLWRHSDMSPSTHTCTQLLLVHLRVLQAHKLHLIMEHGTLFRAYLEQWNMYVHRYRAILTFFAVI